jgi:predicted alpha-1,6-mannanase (GH76 family)
MKGNPRPLSLVALSVAVALSFQAITPCLAQTVATFHDRADQGLQSFLLKFWSGSSQYLRNKYPSDGTLTGYWTYAHGWEALMDGVERTGGQQYAGLIESFYEGQDQRGWYSAYYDDECWMILALLRAFDLNGDTKYLNEAAALYGDVMSGWDTTCCGASKGGLWWDKAHTQKATAANAGAALAGARLYLRTGDTNLLAFAQQVYSYWYANMVNSSTYQVCDHVIPDGTKVWWRFTYNEGLMIGASVALYDATGTAAYLTRAHNIAGYMINNEVSSTAYGPVLYDGSNTGCGGDCHEFKGPAYRYLTQLYAKDTNRTAYLSVLRASDNALWNLARNSTSTVFSVDWAGPVQTNVDEAQVNAACIALNRYAQQSGPYPGSGLPANQYEAENATLHNLGIEALYGPFTGWGYIAGWNANGQSIDFTVNCPRADRYTLAFRYAAGAGDATRLITINGVNVLPNQSFASTGAWGAYSTNALTCTLPAGTSTISITFNSAYGSANYLNLDNLTVIPPDPILITGFTVSPAGSVKLTWTADSGLTYQVQRRTGLDSSSWTNVGNSIVAAGPTCSFVDSAGANSNLYYRVIRP